MNPNKRFIQMNLFFFCDDSGRLLSQDERAGFLLQLTLLGMQEHILFLSFFFFWVIGFHLCIQLALAHSSTTIVLEDVFYDFWSHLIFLLEHTWTSVSSGGWIVSVVCILHTFHLILLWVNKPNAILVWLFGPEHALFAPHQSCLTPPHSFPFKCVSHWPLGNAVLNLNTFLSGQEVKGLTSEHVVNRAYSQHFTSN